MDARTSWETQLVLMAAIVGDEHLDDAGLDAFLAQARAFADQWLTAALSPGVYSARD